MTRPPGNNPPANIQGGHPPAMGCSATTPRSPPSPSYSAILLSAAPTPSTPAAAGSQMREEQGRRAGQNAGMHSVSYHRPCIPHSRTQTLHVRRPKPPRTHRWRSPSAGRAAAATPAAAVQPLAPPPLPPPPAEWRCGLGGSLKDAHCCRRSWIDGHRVHRVPAPAARGGLGGAQQVPRLRFRSVV